jgi:hypothetical protein
LTAINALWKLSSHNTAIDTQGVSSWHHDAFLMTLKTDTVVGKSNPNTRSFDIVIKGTLYEAVSAHYAIPLIKKHIFGIQGEPAHDAYHQKSLFKQQNY